MPPDRERLLLRSAAFARVRRYFESRGFVEVDTPLLVSRVPPEAAIEPFRVTLRTARGSRQRYLPTSPEGALKPLLALLGRDVFEIGHAFRDGEEEGPRHRAHFRLLEWYRLNAGYEALIADTAGLLADLQAFFREQREAPVAPPAALLASDYERVTVPETFERHLDHPIAGAADLAALLPLAHRLGHDNVTSWPEAFHTLVALYVEPHLGRERPTFLTDYPAGIAAQARVHDDRPWLAQQFEIYVEGVELANCYAEITDPQLQRARFLEEARRAGRAEAPDERLLETLGRLPARVAGGSVGLERLLMLWTGAATLDEVRPPAP